MTGSESRHREKEIDDLVNGKSPTVWVTLSLTGSLTLRQRNLLYMHCIFVYTYHSHIYGLVAYINVCTEKTKVIIIF